MTKRFKIVPAVYLVLIKNNKILLLRRFNTGFEDGNYSLVSGHLNGNETLIEGIIREAKEEAGIDITPEDLEVVHVMHRKQPNQERIDFFIQASNWKGDLKNMEPNRCDDLSWFKLNDLPNNIVSYVKCALDDIKNNNFYSEYGW